jgi:hypothetical protein
MGLDIPRLDMGVEAGPRSDLVQAIGRLTRSLKGKPVPEWYSINDLISYTENDPGHPDADSDGNYKVYYDFLLTKAKGRMRSFKQHKAFIKKVAGNIC